MALSATLSVVFMVAQDQEGYFSPHAAGQQTQMWLGPQARHYWEFNLVPNSTSRQIIVGELVGDQTDAS
jgi:hypothetical protein